MLSKYKGTISASIVVLVMTVIVVGILLTGCSGVKPKIGKSAWLTGKPAGTLLAWYNETKTCAEMSGILPVPLMVVYNSGATLIMCNEVENSVCYFNGAIHIPQSVNESDARHIYLHYLLHQKTGLADKSHESKYFGDCVKKDGVMEYIDVQ